MLNVDPQRHRRFPADVSREPGLKARSIRVAAAAAKFVLTIGCPVCRYVAVIRRGAGKQLACVDLVD